MQSLDPSSQEWSRRCEDRLPPCCGVGMAQAVQRPLGSIFSRSAGSIIRYPHSGYSTRWLSPFYHQSHCLFWSCRLGRDGN